MAVAVETATGQARIVMVGRAIAANASLADSLPASRTGSASFADLVAHVTGRKVDRTRLQSYLWRLDVAAGDILIHQDAEADALYFVAEGIVSVHIELPDGKREHLRTAPAGTIVGELGIYAGKRRTATVLADTACRVDCLTAADMERMECDDPDIATLIHRAMTILISEKLAGTNRLIEELMR